jgi:hypothetical protein
MKRISIFASIFVITFLIVAGAVIFSPGDVEARRICLRTLPCHPDNIYCTSDPCSWTPTCYPNSGAVFYCYPDFETEYCSGDYYWPVPCSHIM